MSHFHRHAVGNDFYAFHRIRSISSLRSREGKSPLQTSTKKGTGDRGFRADHRGGEDHQPAAWS